MFEIKCQCEASSKMLFYLIPDGAIGGCELRPESTAPVWKPASIWGGGGTSNVVIRRNRMCLRSGWNAAIYFPRSEQVNTCWKITPCLVWSLFGEGGGDMFKGGRRGGNQELVLSLEGPLHRDS